MVFGQQLLNGLDLGVGASSSKSMRVGGLTYLGISWNIMGYTMIYLNLAQSIRDAIVQLTINNIISKRNQDTFWPAAKSSKQACCRSACAFPVERVCKTDPKSIRKSLIKKKQQWSCSDSYSNLNFQPQSSNHPKQKKTSQLEGPKAPGCLFFRLVGLATEVFFSAHHSISSFTQNLQKLRTLQHLQGGVWDAFHPMFFAKKNRQVVSTHFVKQKLRQFTGLIYLHIYPIENTNLLAWKLFDVMAKTGKGPIGHLSEFW